MERAKREEIEQGCTKLKLAYVKAEINRQDGNLLHDANVSNLEDMSRTSNTDAERVQQNLQTMEEKTRVRNAVAEQN